MAIFLDGKMFPMVVVSSQLRAKRFLGDEYGERAGTDSVSPFIDGARPGHL